MLKLSPPLVIDDELGTGGGAIDTIGRTSHDRRHAHHRGSHLSAASGSPVRRCSTRPGDDGSIAPARPRPTRTCRRRRRPRRAARPESPRRRRSRSAVLLELADRSEANIEPLAQLISREMGKPIRFSRVRELVGAVDKLRFFAGAARLLHGDVTGASPGHLLDLTIPEPLGVAALIIPWNDPVDLPSASSARRSRPAARSSSSRRRRRPPRRAILHLLDRRGLEPGVINLLHGRGDATGAALVAHPGVDKISFTGTSSEVRPPPQAGLANSGCPRVRWQGAEPRVRRLRPGQGRRCARVRGLPLHRPVLHRGDAHHRPSRRSRRVREAFVKRARSLPVGNPLDEATLVGPLVSARQLGRVPVSRRSPRAGAARPRRRATRWRVGRRLYMQPTVFDACVPTMSIAREEIFGPVVAC